MDKFKFPEGEKFFFFLVWVALAGAAIILLIDYQMKRSLLDTMGHVHRDLTNMRLGKGVCADESTGQRGSKGATNSPGNLASPVLGGLSGNDNAGMEAPIDLEHDPFPVRTVSRAREANGRFSATNSDGIPGGGDQGIPGPNNPMES